VQAWRAPRVKVVIATYGLFTATSEVAGALAEHGFGFVIVDESHYLKTRTAARTQLIVPIVKRAAHAVLLSGTPALARPVELYPQITAVCAPGDQDRFGANFTAFTKRYCNARRGRFGWDVSGCSNLDELSDKLRHVMVRRRKAAVLTELPPKTKRRVPIELSGQAATELKRCMEHLRKMGGALRLLNEGGAGGGGGVSGGAGRSSDSQALSVRNEHRRALMEAFQLTGQAKLKGVREYVEQFLLGSDPEDKVIIFAHHIAVLDGIEEGLASHRGNKKKKGARISWMRIDGSTPHSERTANARTFQTDPKCRVALIGMLAGGIGITLTAAAHVFFAELHWTPGVLAQAEDRAHRIGQTRNVQVHYLIGRNSLDDSLWRKIVSKVSVVSEALEGCKERLNVEKVKGNKKAVAGRGGGKRRKLQTKEVLGSDVEFDEGFESEGGEEVEGGNGGPAELDAQVVARGDLRSFFQRAASQESSSSSSQGWSSQESSSSSQSSSSGVAASPPSHSSPPSPGLMSPHSSKRTQSQKRKATDHRPDESSEWQCARCTLLNKALWLRCNACGATRSTFSKVGTSVPDLEDSQRPVEVVEPESVGQVESPSSSSSSSSIPPKKEASEVASLYFSVSPYSGRVYLYGDDKRYLNQSIMPGDLPKITEAVEAANTATAAATASTSVADKRLMMLPQLLVNSPPAVRAFRRFLDSWNSLRPVEQAALAAHLVRPPLHAELYRIRAQAKHAAMGADGGKQSTLSFQRYASASELRKSASSSSSSVSSSSSGAATGRRVCCNCLEPQSTLLSSGTCSWRCHQELATRVSGSAIRRQLFELEKGVCRMCAMDMHAVFQRYKRLQPSDRVQELMRLPGFKVGASDAPILQNPVEGHFWQADHVLPVAEGGGDCSLMNIRTLCTPCHQKETAKLRRRLGDTKLGQSAKGTKDIRGFFSGGDGQKKTKKKNERKREALPGDGGGSGDGVVDLT
jgi:hypothetical protein